MQNFYEVRKAIPIHDNFFRYNTGKLTIKIRKFMLNYYKSLLIEHVFRFVYTVITDNVINGA